MIMPDTPAYEALLTAYLAHHNATTITLEGHSRDEMRLRLALRQTDLWILKAESVRSICMP
jgi:hypothetical protein